VPCYRLDASTPVVDPTAFVHPTAVLIGDVIVGPGCYVGPAACLRGDFGRIVLEAGSNVQDTCVLHGFPGSDTVVGVDGHIGHGAVLHGCRIGRNALVGMNAVVMDEASIGDDAFVAASSFIKAGFVLPAAHLAAGVPARVIRPLRDDEIAWKSQGTREYQTLARRSAATMVEVAPLAQVEPDRPRIGAGDDALRPLVQAKHDRR
jgi:phenylacetic acid degradation protein